MVAPRYPAAGAQGQQRLQAVGAEPGVHALLVPSADPHLSEYLPPRWQGRQWLSGFTGEQIELRPDLDQVPALAGERDQLWARVGAADFLSQDEKRALLGLHPGAPA